MSRAYASLNRALLVTFLIAVAVSTAKSAELDAVWSGGTGDWDTMANWSTPSFPNNGADTYNVFIDDGDATASEVFLDFFATVNNVDLDNNDVLWVNSSGCLCIANDSVVNNAGTIHINSTGNDAYMRPTSGILTLMGGGTVTMSDSTDNWIYQTGGGSFVNVDNTIQGAGNLGWASVPTAITNQGMVIANASNPLICDPGSQLFTNTGTLRADNGGALTLDGSGGFDNAGGIIEALDASTVIVDSTAIRGGTLQTSGSGAIESSHSNATLDGTTDTITNAGLLRIPNGQRFRMSGTINNTGEIEINSTGSNTYLHPQAALLTLTGGGTVTMSDSTDNWIYQQGGGSFVNDDNTIQGAGNLGWSSAPTAITNQGTVIANASNPLICDPGSQLFTNTGTLRADNGGALTLDGSGGFDNAGGIIEALDASTVIVDSTAIRGGTLQTSGSGAIESSHSNATLDGTTDTITNAGLLRIPNNRRFRMSGTINNTGVIEINSTGSNTYLHPQAALLTLTGGGTVTMSDATTNWIYQQGGGSFVNVDNTIQGAGNLGWSSAPTAITNQGTVIADGATVLSVHSGAELFDNQGAMSATGSGGMTIGGNFTTSGTVTVESGSSISRSGDYTQTAGTTTVNGTLSATGFVDIQGGVLTGSGTIEDDVTNAGLVQPGNSAGILTMDADYTQDAAGELSIEIGGLTPGTEHDRLDVADTANLDGTLHIEFINGFDPNVGDSFQIMTYDDRNGDFAAFSAPCLPAGRIVQVSVLDTEVVAFISDALVGDGDCDCALTVLDVEAFVLAMLDSSAYQATYTNCSGLDAVDMNGDTFVNGLDVQAFLDSFIP